MAAYADMEKIANEKGLLFVHLNIRSLINKLDIVRQFLIDTNIDCLCLTETWLWDVITNNLVEIDGYKLVRADRHNTSQFTRGGGICMFIKDIYTL